MLDLLRTRFHQGHRTLRFPDQAPILPDRFRGRPELDPDKCAPDCRACLEVCPTSAIALGAPGLQLDLGRCLFCADCENACPTGAIHYTRDYGLGTRTREELVIRGATASLVRALDEQARRLFGRSLKLRQVSAGGCNACEADVNVLNTVVFDLGRFGIQFVASPRHADGLLITGPVTENMRLALQKTYEAVPAPKIVIAVGACAISGGPFIDHPEIHNGADAVVPVDLYVPGCPPHPVTILDALLRLLGRLEGVTSTAVTQ
jgi:Ni,Fe-hydrogenase III small subunit/Pyruvate/2-oxoacid:ferredoxin oxidoreductase delta subunit